MPYMDFIFIVVEVLFFNILVTIYSLHICIFRHGLFAAAQTFLQTVLQKGVKFS